MRFLEFSSILGTQLKIVVRGEMHDFENLVLSSVIFLGKNMIEHDRNFVLIYINSLFTWILECGLALDQGMLAQ